MAGPRKEEDRFLEERKFETKVSIKVLGYLMGEGYSRKRPQIARRENQVKIRFKEKDKNNDGFIDVLFEKSTFTLKKWIVFTSEDSKTEVLLENLKLNINIQNKIFLIDESDPRHPIWRDY